MGPQNNSVEQDAFTNMCEVIISNLSVILMQQGYFDYFAFKDPLQR